MRNDFLIPNLTRHLALERPEQILDIGSGTAYVPRKIDDCLDYSPQWTLIDIDKARMAVALQNQPSSMQAQLVIADCLTHEFGRKFDAAMAIFTILEFEDLSVFIARLPGLIRSGGLLLVCIPDAWADVIGHPSVGNETIHKFLEGQASLNKIDKFTNEAYPFQAVRIEILISRVLASGFSLIELTESEAEQTRAYLMAFRRNEQFA